MARINYPDSWESASRQALDDLFARAKAEGLWFFHGGLSGPLWFSPIELQDQQERGQFVWGPVNWVLRDPKEALASIDQQIVGLQVERERLVTRMAAGTGVTHAR